MTPDLSPRKAAYYTLGCKLNFAESSTIGKILGDRGFRRALPDEAPDICVINTCSVTETADKKGRSLIRRLSRQWPGATLVVTGCYAQLKPGEVASIEGVDIVLGSKEKLRIAEYLDRWEASRKPIVESTRHNDIRTFDPSCERGERTRWWLKVQDGCDYYCTYCTIPFARGRSRSGLIPDLVEQARRAAASGAKEIVLTGVNVGEFGSDNGQDFLSLLRALDAVVGIERYRISSIEPNLLTEEIIRWVATEARAFMPHFHIPLQAGSDEVLRLMRRHYDTALFRSRVEHIRKVMPHAFIGVDLIVGARGETPELFSDSAAFVESLPVSRLHVFPYSERPGTRALSIDGIVPQEERHLRSRHMIDISERKLTEFTSRFVDTVRPVLVEHSVSADGMMHGFTDNYLKVALPADPSLANTIVNVRLAEAPASDPHADLSATVAL